MNPNVFSFMKRWSMMKGTPTMVMDAWTNNCRDYVDNVALNAWRLKLVN